MKNKIKSLTHLPILKSCVVLNAIKKTQNKRKKKERKNSQPLMKNPGNSPILACRPHSPKIVKTALSTTKPTETVNSKVTTMARSHPQDSYKSRAINSLSKSCLVFNQPKHGVYREELTSVGIESHTRASEDATFIVQHRW